MNNKPFRFWCQKVLPLVYDDSLSYYELLCKVVNYLNKEMEDINTLSGDVSALEKSYQELKSYVDNYFNNLDLQTEINEKLDNMVEDGTLSDIIYPVIIRYATPVFVDSVDDMSDHNLIYVLSTSGTVYYWNGSTWVDTGRLYIGGLSNVLQQRSDIVNGSNLDTLYDAGWYIYPFNASVENDPESATSGRRVVIIYPYSSSPSANTLRFMEYINITTGKVYYRTYANSAWSDWNKGNYYGVQSAITSDTDLDTLFENGWYIFAYDSNPHNVPELVTSGRRMVQVYSVTNQSTADSLRFMSYLNADTGVEYYRVYASGSWGAWHSFKSQLDNLKTSTFQWNDMTGVSDLNVLYKQGWYIYPYSANVANDPENLSSGRRMVFIYPASSNATENTYRIMYYVNVNTAAVYSRFFVLSEGWSDWSKEKIPMTDNQMISTSNYSSTKYVNSFGKTKIKVLAYNVANWNNDSQTFISDEQLHNVKDMIAQVDADIICFTERRQYIDNLNTKLADNYINSPVHGYTYGEGGVVISSKMPATSNGLYSFASGRSMRYAIYTLSEKTLVVCCPHLTPGDTGQETRYTELTEITAWLDTQSYDYAIIAGDFNFYDSTDYANCKSWCDENGYSSGNIGKWDIVETCKVGNNWIAADNIVASENILINRFVSLTSRFKMLYSDHAPVYAVLTLI